MLAPKTKIEYKNDVMTPMEIIEGMANRVTEKP